VLRKAADSAGVSVGTMLKFQARPRWPIWNAPGSASARLRGRVPFACLVRRKRPESVWIGLGPDGADRHRTCRL